MNCSYHCMMCICMWEPPYASVYLQKLQPRSHCSEHEHHNLEEQVSVDWCVRVRHMLGRGRHIDGGQSAPDGRVFHITNLRRGPRQQRSPRDGTGRRVYHVLRPRIPWNTSAACRHRRQVVVVDKTGENLELSHVTTTHSRNR